MKFLFSAAFAVLVGLTSATTRNVDKTAFQNFYDSFGGADWATCEGTTSDPCTLCSWVGCDGDNKITSIEIPNNEYTGTTIVLKAGKIHAFSAIERFTVGSGNSYTYDVSLACVDFEGANDNKCGNTDELYFPKVLNLVSIFHVLSFNTQSFSLDKITQKCSDGTVA